MLSHSLLENASLSVENRASQVISARAHRADTVSDLHFHDTMMLTDNVVTASLTPDPF